MGGFSHDGLRREVDPNVVLSVFDYWRESPAHSGPTMDAMMEFIANGRNELIGTSQVSVYLHNPPRRARRNGMIQAQNVATRSHGLGASETALGGPKTPKVLITGSSSTSY